MRRPRTRTGVDLGKAAAAWRGGRRRAATALAVVLLMIPASAMAQPASAPPRGCVGHSGPLTLSLVPHVPQVVLEIELVLRSTADGTIHDDPNQITLITDQGEQAVPLTAAQAKNMFSNTGQVIVGTLAFGLTGYLATTEARAALVKHIDDTIWTVTEIPPGATRTGSLYFKSLDPKTDQFMLTVDGLSDDSGALPAIHVGCGLVKDASAKTAPPTTTVRTYATALRTASGPLAMTLTRVEFAADSTSADVTVENNSDVEANLFFAKPATVLRDASGNSYALQDLKTTLPDRVPAHGSVHGILVFAPVPRPPLTTAATLSMPNVQLGQDVLELKMDIPF